MDRSPSLAFRITAGVVVLFLFHQFEDKAAKQLTFLAYIVTLFVETWFTGLFKQKAREEGAGEIPKSAALGPQRDSTAGPSMHEHTLRGALSVVAAFIPLAVMADAFFFTDWLDLPAVADRVGTQPGALAVSLKIVASVVALIVAFLGPLAVGVFLYIGVESGIQEEMTRRRRAAGKPATEVVGAGCSSFLVSAAIALASYGHFYVSYVFYDAIGALRS